MSKDSITFRLPCACEHVLEIACSIAVDQGFKITKTDKRGFSAKESVKWGFTNPVTLHVTFLNERASTRVTVDSSNIGFGPVQSNHVRKRMMDFKEELLDLVNTSSMTFSHGDTYPEEEMETSEGGRLINSNREVNTHSQQENNVRVGDHPASNQIKYMVYAIGGILALVLIYSSPVIFLLISAIGSVCWVADALGLAKAANWSAIGRLRQKSEQVYWSTGLIFFLVLVISLFFVNIKPSSVKETETVSENTTASDVSTPNPTPVADIPQPSARKPNDIAPLPDNSKLTAPENTSGEYQQKKEYASTIQEQSEIPAPIPNEQQVFVNIISKYASEYDEASNDIRRSAARAERKKELQRYVDSPGAENWSGKITSIDIEADNTTIEIQLTDTEITLINYLDAFFVSMTPENTVIRSDMPIYQKVLSLKKGDYVRFNFRFEPGLLFTDDGLYQTRITENNSMVKPIFLVEFWDIEKYIQGSPSIDKRTVTTTTTVARMPGQPSLPQDQQIFNGLIEKYSRQYAVEASEIRKTQLRRDRKNELLPYGSRGKIQNWIGKVDNINLSSDGEIMLSVVLNGSRTKIMNYLDALFFGMSIEDVLIKPGTNLFETVADLKEDDLIVVDFMFHGDSIYAAEDGIIQMEISEEESMRVPEFLVEFVSIKKWTYEMNLVSESTITANMSTQQPTVTQSSVSTGKNEGIVRVETVLNVRDYPSEYSNVIATIGSGTRVPILGIDASGEWLKVSIPGLGEKWVAKEYVELPDMPISEAVRQTEVIDADDKIIVDYLSENLPGYMILNPTDYYDLRENETYSAPWRISSDFDGNGYKDFALIAIKKSNYKAAILILNYFGNSIKHVILDDNLSFEQAYDYGEIGLFLKEPGPIEVPADEEEFEGPWIQIGTAKYPYMLLGEDESDVIYDKYWWESGRYHSTSDEYRLYREDSSQSAIVNIQGSLNLRESPSTDANIVTILPPGAQVIVIKRPHEKYPWVKVQFNGQKGWVHGDYLTSEENEYMPEEQFIEDEELKVTIPTSASIGEGPSIINITAKNPTNEERMGTIAFSIDGGEPVIQENPSAYDLFEVGGNNKLLRFSSDGSEWKPLASTEAISPSMVHVELYDGKWTAGEIKTLSCPVSFTEPGEVLILVRATFARKSSEGTIVDTNFPVQGHNDEQGLPCALYQMSVSSGVRNPINNVISQTTEQTAAYAVAETYAASPEEDILGQTIVYFNKLVNKDLEGAMVGISDKFEHSEYGRKAQLKLLLEEGRQAGYLDDLIVSVDDAEAKFEDDKVVMYPIDMMSSFGSITLELTCTKEGDTWKLTTMDIFGI